MTTPATTVLNACPTLAQMTPELTADLTAAAVTATVVATLLVVLRVRDRRARQSAS